MDIRGMIRIHEAGRAFQVAPVGQIDDQGKPSSGLDARRPVVVDRFVIRARVIVPNVKRFDPPEERGVSREDVFEGAVPGALLSHHDSTRFLDDLRIDQPGFFAELRNGALAGEDGIDRLPVAFRTKRLRAPRKPERRCRSFVALRQRSRRPCRRGPRSARGQLTEHP